MSEGISAFNIAHKILLSGGRKLRKLKTLRNEHVLHVCRELYLDPAATCRLSLSLLFLAVTFNLKEKKHKCMK